MPTPPTAFAGSFRGWVSRVLSAPWIDRARTNRLYSTDPWDGFFGRKFTLPWAYVWCFFVSWPVSIVEFSGIPLMIAVLARVHRSVRFIPSILLQPLLLAVAIFGIIQFISLLWSQDRAEGIDQAGSIRWLWSLFMLWSVIEYRRSLIIVLAAGFLIGNASQASQFLHIQLDWPTPTWDRAPDRYSGWWPPVVGGSVLTAALGLHLPAVFLPGSMRTRILAAAASFITLTGIFATGTRGAWIASAALIPIVAFACVVVRGRAAPVDRPASRASSQARWVLAASCVVVIAAGMLWIWMGDAVSRRIALARQDIAAALTSRDFSSDTGARLGMALVAIDLFREHPWLGVGTGSYRPAAESLVRERAEETSAWRIHDHAHNGLLHIAATTGVLGLCSALLVVILALRNAVHLGLARWQRHGAYEWGPAGALVGLLAVSMFDPVHINAQTSAMLAVLLSLCPSFVPDSSADRQANP